MTAVDTPRCARHAEATGSPCPRCGTFACAACLGGSAQCPACQALLGPSITPPTQFAGLGVRIVARVLDTGFFLGAVMVGGLAGGIALGLLEAMGRPMRAAGSESLGEGLSSLFFLGIWALSAAIATRFGLATLGKALVGLRVVSVDGSAPSFAAALKREVLAPIDLMFFGAVGLSRMSRSPLVQRYGDAWARSVVVRAPHVSPAVAVGVGQVVVANVAGLAVAAALSFGVLVVSAL